MITIDNLTLPYGLTGINCHIPAGKLVGIMGANGAGKSTLLKVMAGIFPLTGKSTSGQILLKNRPLGELSPIQKSQQIAYLAQNTAIQWDLCVYDVIALGLTTYLPAIQEQQKVAAVAEQFSLLDLLAKPFRQLSGGEKTRVQLARCAIKNAPILLADEPIAALDPYYQIDIMQRLKALTPQATCVVVIHHLSLAYRFCDEIILLNQGRMIASGATQEVLNAENIANAFGVKVEIDPIRREIFAVEKLS